MADLKISRDQLAQFLPDHQLIRAFEQLFVATETTLPESSDDANNNAAIAITVAQGAVAALSEIAEQLSALLAAPPAAAAIEPNDLTPRVELGTMASQNADSVAITGGSIDGVALGAAAPGSAVFTSISYSGQLTSTVATGTAPMVVASTTKVANLNVDLLDGGDWASPGALGATTPNTAVVTSLTSNSFVTSTGNMNAGGNLNSGNGTTNVGAAINGANSGTAGGASVVVQNAGTSIIAIGNKSAIIGGAYSATPYIFGNATIEVHTGVKFLSTTGFNNTAPIAKPTVTGSRGGNAALASLLTALANYGLITDSTTA
jgi:hypothetical protein